MHLRHLFLAALLAAGLLTITGAGRSQEPDDEPKAKAKTPAVDPAAAKAATKAAADAAKAVADLKKAVADQAAELKSLKAEHAKLAESATGAAADLGTIKAGAKASEAKVDAAAKSIDGMQKSIADAKADFDASKKAADEGLKGVAGIKTSAEGAAAMASDGDISRGDTAWMLVACAFVFIMVPGLALFYGGMVRRKNILATMMQSLACLSVVGLFWIAVGYGLAFGPSVLKLDSLGLDGGVIGWSWDLFFLQNVGHADVMPGYKIPVYVHVMFQGMFAIITPALISGAVAERIRFWPFCIFVILWISFVYCPLAHMVWAFDSFDMTIPAAKRGVAAIGVLGKLGAEDFAGGTVVHIAAGFAGLAACLVLRRRDGYPKSAIHPSSMVLTLLGAGLLWFGWFGFNGGSGLASNGQAGSAFAATQAAAATAGLVAVTPASGFVYVWGGVAIGALAAVGCYAAVMVKNMLGYDDSLDAFGVHGVGGFVGAVLTGVFCYGSIAGADGTFAVWGQESRVKMLEKSGIADAEKASQEQAAKLAAVKPELDALAAKPEADLTETEKTRLTELKDIDALAAERAAAVPKLQKEVTDLKTKAEARSKDEKGAFSQLSIQIKASVASAVFAFVLSLGLVLLVQAITLGNFTTSHADETVGLDQTEHGEAGFDFGLAAESSALTRPIPTAALTPRIKSTRFDLAVEGADKDDIVKLWTGLCQPSETPAPPDFLAVYPHVTTMTGNHFQCRGTDAPAVAARLEQLFKKLIPGKPVRVVKL
jgi:Amt family ammonium transporter